MLNRTQTTRLSYALYAKNLGGNMEDRNKGLVIFGIMLLAMGLFASFYKVTIRVGQPPARVNYEISYPYQNAGIILVIIAIIFLGFGLFHSFNRTRFQSAILHVP